MLNLAADIEGVSLTHILDNPDLVLEHLPQSSPFLSLQERLDGIPTPTIQDFIRTSARAIHLALTSNIDLSGYTMDELSLATRNLDLLSQLLAADCSAGVISLDNFRHQAIPSRAAINLATQFEQERNIAVEHSIEVTIDALNLQLLELARQVMTLEVDEEARGLFLALIETQKLTIINLAQNSCSLRSKELAGRMSERSNDLLDLLSIQFLDLRRYFSGAIPNRDYILAVLSDEIVRRVNGRYPLNSFDSIGVWIGDINSLSVANLRSHIGGDRYIGFIGDVLSRGLTSIILRMLGGKVNREITSLMRGADEAGALMSLQRASVRTVSEVLCNLRLKEVGLYSVDDIVDLNDKDLLLKIGRILGLDSAYRPKPGEKFGAAVTFAGDSFLYALAKTTLDHEPTSFYEALRCFVSCLLDTTDRRAMVLKDEVKNKIAENSPANFGLQSASRAFLLLVDYMRTNAELSDQLGFLTEGNLADIDKLERIMHLLKLKTVDKRLIRAVINAKNGNSQMLQFLTGHKKRESRG